MNELVNINNALKAVSGSWQRLPWTRLSASILVLPSITYDPHCLYWSLLVPHPLARDPNLSLPSNGKPPNPPGYVIQGLLLSRPTSPGAQQTAGRLPRLSRLLQTRPACHLCTTCKGSRGKGWLPWQRRIKPLLCQAADWLRQVPPPPILRVGGRGKGL